MPNPGDIIGGRFEIIRELGSGGFGTTYLANDLNVPQSPQCVVKQLQPRFNSPTLWRNAKERFAIEAKVLQRLGVHEQIPQVISHIEEEDTQNFYLVQELIDGEELRREVSHELFNEKKAIALLLDVLKVLEFVHQQGVIHRDIKPSNLIRRQADRKINLIDFGAVKEMGTLAFDETTKTMMTSIIGTPGYMAPEQFNGKPVFSSDIYALGMTVIFALTGRSPLDLEDTELGNSSSWKPSLIISPQLQEILSKMTARKTTERYHTVREVLEDLEPLLPIGKVVGNHYTISQYLGSSPASDTYLAKNISHSEPSSYSLKKLRSNLIEPSLIPEAKQQFSKKLMGLEKLGSHAQIPKILEQFEQDKELYFLQEFIEGKSLEETLKTNHSLSQAEVLKLLRDGLEVLSFIHQNGIIHCNIKPSNIIYRYSDRKYVLIDFASFKEITNIPLTRSLNGYTPPEQIAGSPVFSSDLYALGMTAIQALTGISPTSTNFLEQHTSQFHPKLVQILTKMTQLNVSQRYSSAIEALRDVIKLSKKPNLEVKPAKISSLKPWQKVLLYSGGTFILLRLVIYVVQISQAGFLFTIADLRLKAGEYKTAIEYFDEGLKKAPPLSGLILNFEKAWIQKAYALSALKEYDNMLQACEGAIALKPNSSYAWICKGTALDRLQKYPQAILAYDRAIDINENSFEAWHNRGQTHLQLEQPKRAIEDFQKAIKVDSQKSFVTWNDLGQLYYRTGQYADAIKAYQEAVKIKSDYLPAWIGLGNVETAIKNHKNAITAYQKALKIDDTSYEAWYRKGLAEEALKQYNEALNSYERAIFIKPNYQAAIDARQRVMHLAN